MENIEKRHLNYYRLLNKKQGGIDTSDATATVNDILDGKTAYANNQKLTGTLIPTELNLFIQNEEPETFNGIWLKTDSFEYDNIVEIQAKANVVASSINIVKGTDLETIIYNDENNLRYLFKTIFLTDSNNNIIYDIPTYYGDGETWIDITPLQSVIYGIKRLLNTSNPAWERTDDAIGMVANATKDGTAVQNDFDSAPIYKDIITQNYNMVDQEVIAEYGEQNFTFTPASNNIAVMTYIPEFWARRWRDETYEYIQITNAETEGFIHIPARRVGRYRISGSTSAPITKSGMSPLLGVNIINLRNAVKTISSDTSLLDIWTWNIIQILYLVEYASYNSQDKLGLGYTSGAYASTIKESGECDSLGMKSGTLNDDGFHSMVYRGIENIYGNSAQWLDGINLQNSQAYICRDYTKYVSDIFSGDYIKLGYVSPSNSNAISALGYDENNQIVMLPSSANGTDSTYITDTYYQGTNNRISRCGGSNNSGLGAGLFAIDNAESTSGTSLAKISSRCVQYDTTAI